MQSVIRSRLKAESSMVAWPVSKLENRSTSLSNRSSISCKVDLFCISFGVCIKFVDLLWDSKREFLRLCILFIDKGLSGCYVSLWNLNTYFLKYFWEFKSKSLFLYHFKGES